MTLNQFRLLDEEQQYNTIWEKAVQVGERENDVYVYVLYQLDGFYIEIRFSKNDCSVSMRNFCRERRLRPYLNAIDLKTIDIFA